MNLLVPQDLFLQRQKIVPKSIRNIFFDPTFNKTVGNAIILARLESKEEKEKFIDVIMAVLLFIIPRNAFKQELQSRINISSSQIEILDKIIQDKIFEPLKNELEQYKSLLPTQTVETIKSEAAPTIEMGQSKKVEIKPKKIEELVQPTRPIEEKPKEEPQSQLTPEPPLPEIPEIKIERPINKSGELKRVTAPKVTSEEQEKIHSRLLEAIQKKEVKPKILEQIKKVLESGVNKQTETKTPEKPVAPAEAPSASKVVGGDSNEKFKTEPKPTSSSQKPYIFDVKLKQEAKTKEEISPKDIKYQKTTEKPFGEA
ncbi:MAG: hypothetical protein GYA31_02525 [Parcubacteria group bacterium]|nr:hypothetical protein [Parcubacteria group bacterium]